MSLLLDLLQDAVTVYNNSISRFLPSNKASLLQELYKEHKLQYDSTINYEEDDAGQQLTLFNNTLARAILQQKETQTATNSNDALSAASTAATSTSPPKFDTLLGILKTCAHIQLHNIDKRTASRELDKSRNCFKEAEFPGADSFLRKVNHFIHLTMQLHTPTAVIAASSSVSASTIPKQKETTSSNELAALQEQLAQQKTLIEKIEKEAAEKLAARQAQLENQILELQDTPNGKLLGEITALKKTCREITATNEENIRKGLAAVAKKKAARAEIEKKDVLISEHQKRIQELESELQTAKVKLDAQEKSLTSHKKIIVELESRTAPPTPAPAPPVAQSTTQKFTPLKPSFSPNVPPFRINPPATSGGTLPFFTSLSAAPTSFNSGYANNSSTMVKRKPPGQG